MMIRRSANAVTLQLTKKTKITYWGRMRTAGWTRELSPHGDGGWTYSISWGRPRIHSRLAFLISVQHRP